MFSKKKSAPPQTQPESREPKESSGDVDASANTNVDTESGPHEGNEEDHRHHATWISAVLLGAAMVARGEIGLLIIEIGYNSTSYVSEEGFITGVWAILLNTIIGPVAVGLLVKFYGKHIGEGKWGLQEAVTPARQ